MAAEDVPNDDALVGRRAVDWLMARANGGHYFDGAFAGVMEGFGSEVAVGALAPLGPSADPSDFFFVVDGNVDQDEAWERLVRAHLVLYEQTAFLWVPATTRPRRPRDPFDRFHLVMEPQPTGAVQLGEATNAWLRAK